MVHGRGELREVSRESQRPPKRLLQEGVAGHVPDPVLLDDVVVSLHKLNRRGFESTLAIGKLILTRFFGGNPALWRKRERNKNNSIRRLAERPDCPMGRSKLNDSVAIYVLVCAHPCVRTFGHVEPSHLRAVFPLDSADQLLFLQKAELEKWPVSRLKEEVTRYKHDSGERRGRPPLSPDEKVAAQLSRFVAELNDAVDNILESSPTPANRDALRQTADELRLVEAKVRGALEGRTSSMKELRPSGTYRIPDLGEAAGKV